MGDTRTFLPPGTKIQLDSGSLYEITGAPIGSGGSGILYPADRLFRMDGEIKRDGIVYALKECYPASMDRRFIRAENGEIVPAAHIASEYAFLETVKRMQNAERQVTQSIYRTGSRILPIREAAEHITLTLPGQRPAGVNNTITVMESLTDKGSSLNDCVRQHRQLTCTQTFAITQQILFALREVHRAGYVHLDVQGGNVFLKGSLEDGSSLITLIDFGSARPLLGQRTAPVTDRVVFTTEGFSAPEIFDGNDGTLQLGPEADLYSVGCLMLLLLTGARPDSAALMHNTTGKYITRFRLRRIHCPAHLVERMQAIIAHALQRDPANRYHSADEMLADVTDFLYALQPPRSALRDVAYDAFICYKHSPADSLAARTLQQQLEHFRAPKAVSEQRRPFRRVFLDEGELASCADFGAQIRTALENSGWLIVVCSPDTPASPWVKQEIDVFLETHARSRILAVLIAGEPASAFPPQLLGNSVEDQVFAADARGEDQQQMISKLKRDALLRLAAPMLGTTFDALKQRQRVWQLQRVAAVTAVGLVLSLSFAVYAIGQNRQIRAETARADAEYRNALTSQNRLLAQQAQELLDGNDSLGAIELALSAVTTGVEQNIAVPEAEYVLSQALGLYTTENSSTHIPAVGSFRHSASVDSFFVDEERGLLFSCDGENIYVWNTADCTLKLCIEAQPGESFTVLQPGLQLAKQHRLIVAAERAVCCYDYTAGALIWRSKPLGDEITALYYIDGRNMLAGMAGSSLYLFDAATGQLLHEETFPFDVSMDLYRLSATFGITASYNAFACSADGSQIAFNVQTGGLSYISDYDTNDQAIIVYNLEDNTYNVLNPEAGYIRQLLFTADGRLLCASFRGYSMSASFSSYGREEGATRNTGLLSMLDTASGDILWQQQQPFSGGTNALLKPADADNVIWSCGNKCALVNPADGTLLESWELTGTVIAVLPHEEGDGFNAVTEDGRYYIFYYGRPTWRINHFFPDYIDSFAQTADGFFVLYDDAVSYSSDLIIKYDFSRYDDSWQSVATMLSEPPSQYYIGEDLCVLASGRQLYCMLPDAAGPARQISIPASRQCEITVEGFGTVCMLDGEEVLLIHCIDDCGTHPRHCIAALKPATGEIELQYLPMQAEQYVDAVAICGSTVYYVCSGSIGENACTLYTWQFGSDEPVAVAQIQPAGRARCTVTDICADENGSILLAGLQAYADGRTSDRIVWRVDAAQNTAVQIVTLPIGYADTSLIRQNADGLWTGVTAEGVTLYGADGQPVASLQPPTNCHAESLSFTPDEQQLLVLYRVPDDSYMLAEYNAADGELLHTLELQGTALGNGNYTWCFAGDTLVLSSANGSAEIDIAGDTWAVRSFVENAIGYDPVNERFYVSELESGRDELGHSTWYNASGYRVGYFTRYSTNELIRLAQQALGADAESGDTAGSEIE